jgi:hypothetical protein
MPTLSGAQSQNIRKSNMGLFCFTEIVSRNINNGANWFENEHSRFMLIREKKGFFRRRHHWPRQKSSSHGFFLSPRRENFQLVESDVTLMDVWICEKRRHLNGFFDWWKAMSWPYCNLKAALQATGRALAVSSDQAPRLKQQPRPHKTYTYIRTCKRPKTQGRCRCSDAVSKSVFLVRAQLLPDWERRRTELSVEMRVQAKGRPLRYYKPCRWLARKFPH